MTGMVSAESIADAATISYRIFDNPLR